MKDTASKVKKTDPDEPMEQCQYFLTKKKRLCRFRPKPGQRYCPEHGCVMGIDDGRKRIPCPLNPKHNCYEDELQKHLRICNVTKIRQKTQKEVYFSEGINKTGGTDIQSPHGNNKVSIKDLTSKDLANLIGRVNSLYKERVESINTAIFEHPCVREEFGAETGEDLSDILGKQGALKKELLQQASLIGQLECLHCLHGNNCFVELGAGKGKLSHWIHKACNDAGRSSFVLVERSSVRYKVDGAHKPEDGNTQFRRIKIDIEDLNLGPLPEVNSHPSVIVVGKHLCGGATDMGLRCAVNTLQRNDISKQQQKQTIDDVPISKSELFEKQCSLPAHLDSSQKRIQQINSKDGPVISNSSVTRSCDNAVGDSHKDKEETLRLVPDEAAVNLSPEGEPKAKSPKLCNDQHMSADTNSLPTAIMIALCCHHRCTWETYAGRKFMGEIGVSPEEFDLLTRLSSWATCAKETAKAKRIAEEKKVDGNIPSNQSSTDESYNDKEHCVEDMMANCQSISLRESLSVLEREEIGLKCKRLIDMGRLHYLREAGMHCYLRKYIDDSLTPENVVLIATVK